jgi:hypothetical protein
MHIRIPKPFERLTRAFCRDGRKKLTIRLLSTMLTNKANDDEKVRKVSSPQRFLDSTILILYAYMHVVFSK